MSTLVPQLEYERTPPTETVAAGIPVRKPWMVSRIFDVMFVCGMAPWIFGALAYLVVGTDLKHAVGSPQLKGLTFAFVVASFLIGESHQFTSILRYYSGVGSRTKGFVNSRFPIWIIYFFAVFGFVVLQFDRQIPDFLGASQMFSISFGTLAVLGILFFPVVLAQHFCAQAKAVGLLYCGKAGYSLSPMMKFVLSIATVMLCIAGACTIALPFGSMFFLSQEIGRDGLLSSLLASFGHSVGIVAVLIFAVPTVFRGLFRGEWLPVGAVLTWGNLALFMMLPFSFMVYVWLFVPVLFHASQHWAVAWDAKCRENKTPIGKVQLLREVCFFVLPVQAVSLVVLFLPLLFLKMTTPGGSTPPTTLDIMWSMLVFYMHYFTDRIVWRPQTTERKYGKQLLRAAEAP